MNSCCLHLKLRKHLMMTTSKKWKLKFVLNRLCFAHQKPHFSFFFFSSLFFFFVYTSNDFLKLKVRTTFDNWSNSLKCCSSVDQQTEGLSFASTIAYPRHRPFLSFSPFWQRSAPKKKRFLSSAIESIDRLCFIRTFFGDDKQLKFILEINCLDETQEQCWSLYYSYIKIQ